MGAGVTNANFPAAAGRLAFGSVTGSYAALLSAVGAACQLVVITNSLDAETVISLDGGTTEFIYLPAGQGLVISLSNIMWSGTLSVKHNGAAPTSGAISAGVIAAN